MKLLNLNLVIVIIFTGSVFVTSGKFVDAYNTPKFYFVVMTMIVLGAVLSIRAKNICLSNVIAKRIVLGEIFTICFIQVFYGLCQFFGWSHSNDSQFAITGSFDNPAGFAATLAMGFPIGLFLFKKSKDSIRYYIAIGLTLIVITVFLSESRAGMFVIIISPVILVSFKTNIIGHIRQCRLYKFLFALFLFLLIAVFFLFYFQKKNSANGRLLIWQVSYEMIKDKPILGHGYNTFKAKYMDYQAAYFAKHPDSEYSQLADNVKHPFNEFILLTVENGIIGCFVVLVLIFITLRRIKKLQGEYRSLVLSGFAALGTFACFSYPFQYVAVWVLVVFYISLLLPTKVIELKRNPAIFIARTVIVVSSCICILYAIIQIKAEIKWNYIAHKSLRGQTIEMLPEYEKLYPYLKRNPFFLYNYGAELNVAGKYDKSIDVLTKCQKWFNDYDLQLLVADNYQKKGEPEIAIGIYKHASNMIPCRFYPLYQLFRIYKEAKMADKACLIANEILSKKEKIQSSTIYFIKAEAKKYLESVRH